MAKRGRLLGGRLRYKLENTKEKRWACFISDSGIRHTCQHLSPISSHGPSKSSFRTRMSTRMAGYFAEKVVPISGLQSAMSLTKLFVDWTSREHSRCSGITRSYQKQPDFHLSTSSLSAWRAVAFESGPQPMHALGDVFLSLVLSTDEGMSYIW